MLGPAVALTPSDRWPILHGYAILAAAAPGLAGLVLAAVGLWLERGCPRHYALLTTTFLAVALVDLATYFPVVLLDAPWTRFDPAIEKAAFLLGVAWMFLTGLRARRLAA